MDAPETEVQPDEQGPSGVSLEGLVEVAETVPDATVEEELPTEPTPGMSDAEQVDACQRLELLAREANQALTRPINTNGLSLPELWDQSGRRYIGDQWDYDPMPGHKHEVVNKVMGVAITHTAAEIEHSPHVRFTPQETMDEPRAVFIKPKGIRKLNRAMMLGRVQQIGEQAPTADQPISMDQYEMLIGSDGLPPVLSPDDFWLVNDKLLSKFAQDIHDLQWRRACGDAVWSENTILKNILGSCPILCEWNADRNNVVLSNPHIKNVWIDPTARRIEDARYVGFDQVLDAEQAKEIWPQFEALIDQAAQTGTLNDSREIKIGSVYTRTSFERKMLIQRTVWERGHRRPMTEQEALDAERVVRVQPRPFTVDEAMQAGQVQPSPMGGLVDAQGMPADPSMPSWPVQPGYYALPNGEPVTPDAPAWPTTEAVLETVVLVDIQRVLSSRICPYWDIPLAMPVNIPIPYSVYGLGEPARLEDVQQMANRVLSAISTLIRAGAYPQEYMPKELIEELEAAGIQPHASPNNIIPIDGAQWERWFGQRGRLGFAVDAPQVNETFIRLVDMFLKLVDELGGNAGVLQGRAPAGTSGEAIASLTANARGPLALKSEHSEQALERVARLILDMALKYMPDAIISRHFASYPPALLSYLKQAVSSMEFDVDVEIASGKGANKQINEQQALERLKVNAITLETAQEQMGINVDMEKQRRLDQAQEAAKAQMAMAQAMPQPAPGGPAGTQPNGPRQVNGQPG